MRSRAGRVWQIEAKCLFASLVASWLDRWLKQGKVCSALFKPQRTFYLVKPLVLVCQFEILEYL